MLEVAACARPNVLARVQRRAARWREPSAVVLVECLERGLGIRDNRDIVAWGSHDEGGELQARRIVVDNEYPLGDRPEEQAERGRVEAEHLQGASRPVFGRMPLGAIDFPAIARFRATLIKAGLGDKRINNILAVLSKALNYAEQAKVISSAPSVGMLKVERPEIVAWSLEEYATLLAAAKKLDPMWYAASCLAGEAGLRVGEVRALDWKRDVDLVGRTITVNKQIGLGQTTTPKGPTRRTVPMTDTLYEVLKAPDTIRTGFVIRTLDGSGMTDNETKCHCYRICRAAGLPERGWRNLRIAELGAMRNALGRLVEKYQDACAPGACAFLDELAQHSTRVERHALHGFPRADSASHVSGFATFRVAALLSCPQRCHVHDVSVGDGWRARSITGT
jgi:integrase